MGIWQPAKVNLSVIGNGALVLQEEAKGLFSLKKGWLQGALSLPSNTYREVSEMSPGSLQHCITAGQKQQTKIKAQVIQSR